MLHFNPPPSAKTPSASASLTRFARWLELLLTVIAIAVLFLLAAPLATPGTETGLFQRYSGLPVLAEPLSWQVLYELTIHSYFTAMPSDWRAIMVLRHAGPLLAVLGGLGWLALQLARRQSRFSMLAAIALWLLAGALLRPFQLSGQFWWWTVCAVVISGMSEALIIAPLMRRPVNHPPAKSAPFNAWMACVWPGWLLLPSIAILVNLDFGARGPVTPGGMAMEPVRAGVRYFGLSQLDAWWLATGAFLVVVYLRTWLLQSVVRLGRELAALWQRPRGPWLLTLLAVLLALALGWLGYFKTRGAFLGVHGWHGAGKPYVSGEMLRLLACGVLAWFAYRVGEWETSRQRALASLKALLCLGLISVVGLLTSGDNGPLLVLALAFLVLLGAPWLRHRPENGRALLLALLLCAAVLALWQIVLMRVLPQFSLMAFLRWAMAVNPFTAESSSNLAHARWLTDAAAPSGGFGLGRVPYCGAQALAYANDLSQAGRCTLHSGAPLQMPSDMAFAPLVATFGMYKASALVMLALLWLFALPAGQLAAWRASTRRRSPVQRTLGLLPVWLVAIACLTAQAQIIISVGATLGWSALTGVTLPLLGYGSWMLFGLALWVGLAAGSASEA